MRLPPESALLLWLATVLVPRPRRAAMDGLKASTLRIWSMAGLAVRVTIKSLFYDA